MRLSTRAMIRMLRTIWSIDKPLNLYRHANPGLSRRYRGPIGGPGEERPRGAIRSGVFYDRSQAEFLKQLRPYLVDHFEV
jgi:hypothetical protein